MASAEARDARHKGMFFGILLADDLWCLGDTPKSVVCVDLTGFLAISALFVGAVLVLLHELSKVDGLARSVEVSFASTTSNWLMDLLVVEESRSKATSSAILRSIDVGRGAKWHHQTLNMILIDTTILMKLLKQLIVLVLLLDQNNSLFVVSLPALEITDLLILDKSLLIQLFNLTL